MPNSKLLTRDDAADIVDSTPRRIFGILNASFLPFDFGDYPEVEQAFIAREYRLRLEALCEQLRSIESYGYMMAESLTLPDGWTLHTINRNRQTIDAAKLRNLDPEAYEDLAYIENSDCVKLLGRPRIRDAIRAFKQTDCLPAYERVNVSDARTRLTTEVLNAVTKTDSVLDYKFMSYLNLGTETKNLDWDWEQ